MGVEMLSWNEGGNYPVNHNIYGHSLKFLEPLNGHWPPNHILSTAHNSYTFILHIIIAGALAYGHRSYSSYGAVTNISCTGNEVSIAQCNLNARTGSVCSDGQEFASVFCQCTYYAHVSSYAVNMQLAGL